MGEGPAPTVLKRRRIEVFEPEIERHPDKIWMQRGQSFRSCDVAELSGQSARADSANVQPSGGRARRPQLWEGEQRLRGPRQWRRWRGPPMGQGGSQLTLPGGTRAGWSRRRRCGSCLRDRPNARRSDRRWPTSNRSNEPDAPDGQVVRRIYIQIRHACLLRQMRARRRARQGRPSLGRPHAAAGRRYVLEPGVHALEPRLDDGS